MNIIATDERTTLHCEIRHYTLSSLIHSFLDRRRSVPFINLHVFLYRSLFFRMFPLFSCLTFTNLFFIFFFLISILPLLFFFFFFNYPAPPEFSPFPLHAALPIYRRATGAAQDEPDTLLRVRGGMGERGRELLEPGVAPPPYGGAPIQFVDVFPLTPDAK